MRPQLAHDVLHQPAFQHLRCPLVGRHVQVEIAARAVETTGLAIETAPVIDQLVPRDSDQPGHGHLVDPASLNLADRSEEGFRREILGELAMTATRPVVAVHLIDGDVVDGEQIGGVLAASFRNRFGHHAHHRPQARNSDTRAPLGQNFGRSTVLFTAGSGSVVRVSSERVDIAVIGAGPAGAATAIQAARSGAKVVVFEKGAHGRDKVCGDGLTPRAVGALNELKIELGDAHHIQGLRMIAGKQVRELDWPTTDRFPNHGAVWPRRRLDAALMDAAVEAGANLVYETEAVPRIEHGRVVGVVAGDRVVDADLTVVAAGAQGAVARMLGADRVPDEPFGLAIRTYAATPRHADAHLEACLSLRDEHGTAIPGYGWMFPAGDGTVNIGVGALSTMKGFKQLNLNTLLESYRHLVRDAWDLGPNLERPRAWRLPMSTQRRHGPGWVAIGDAAGLVNPMNGEGIDYGLESGILAADLFLADPATAPARYDELVGERFDAFLRTGRRFSFLIGHPWILKPGLRLSVSTDAIANITLAVMGNLVDNSTPGAAGKVMWLADKSLGLADPLLRKTRAAA
jgi:menaquinone-9 beta-reductase